MAANQVAVCETLFYGLQSAAEHILLKFVVTVLVPDFYVVVVLLYVVEVILIYD